VGCSAGKHGKRPPPESRFFHLHSACLARHHTAEVAKRFVVACEWRPCGSAIVAGFTMDGLLWLSGCACNAGSSHRPRLGSSDPLGAIAQSGSAKARRRIYRMSSLPSRGPTPRATASNPTRSPCPAAEAGSSPRPQHASTLQARQRVQNPPSLRPLPANFTARRSSCDSEFDRRDERDSAGTGPGPNPAAVVAG